MQPDHYWPRSENAQIYTLHNVQVSLKTRLENSSYKFIHLTEALDLSRLIDSKSLHDLVGLGT